eukprot:ANDGO_04625.mRNA.1 NAD-dependent protein deacetylase hst2
MQDFHHHQLNATFIPSQADHTGLALSDSLALPLVPESQLGVSSRSAVPNLFCDESDHLTLVQMTNPTSDETTSVPSSSPALLQSCFIDLSHEPSPGSSLEDVIDSVYHAHTAADSLSDSSEDAVSIHLLNSVSPKKSVHVDVSHHHLDYFQHHLHGHESHAQPVLAIENGGAYKSGPLSAAASGDAFTDHAAADEDLGVDGEVDGDGVSISLEEEDDLLIEDEESLAEEEEEGKDVQFDIAERFVLDDLTDIHQLAVAIRKARKIVVMTGAGISRAAGIPCFRGADGLFAELLRDYPNLSDPSEALDRDALSDEPQMVYDALSRLWPRPEWRPTACHYLLRLLHESGRLLRLYTQNIDDLDVVAGVPRDKLVRLHGNFERGVFYYQNQKVEYPLHLFERMILEKKVPVLDLKPISIPLHMKRPVEFDEVLANPNKQYRNHHFVFLRPDVTLYHDDVGQDMDQWFNADAKECDMVIVIGTSLEVSPANSIAKPGYDYSPMTETIKIRYPRVWVNRSNPPRSFGFFFGTVNDNGVPVRTDYKMLCESDRFAVALAEELGWSPRLHELFHSTPAKRSLPAVKCGTNPLLHVPVAVQEMERHSRFSRRREIKDEVIRHFKAHMASRTNGYHARVEEEEEEEYQPKRSALPSVRKTRRCSLMSLLDCVSSSMGDALASHSQGPHGQIYQALVNANSEEDFAKFPIDILSMVLQVYNAIAERDATRPAAKRSKKGPHPAVSSATHRSDPLPAVETSESHLDGRAAHSPSLESSSLHPGPAEDDSDDRSSDLDGEEAHAAYGINRDLTDRQADQAVHARLNQICVLSGGSEVVGVADGVAHEIDAFSVPYAMKSSAGLPVVRSPFGSPRKMAGAHVSLSEHALAATACPVSPSVIRRPSPSAIPHHGVDANLL